MRYKLTRRASIGSEGYRYKRGDEINEIEYNSLPQSIKAFFDPIELEEKETDATDNGQPGDIGRKSSKRPGRRKDKPAH